MDTAIIDQLGLELPTDTGRFVLVDFYDNQCHTNFSGYWDGKMVKAAIRSIERQYAAQKHMMTRNAAQERMTASLANKGSE